MVPAKLASLVDYYAGLTDRAARVEALIDLAATFRDVPPTIARRPFPEVARVPACESEAFVFAVPTPDRRLDLHFAVENPQGLSAKALAALLAKGLSGLPAEQLVDLPGDLPLRVFGNELSMGKNMGLSSMVGMVRNAARRLVAAVDASGQTAPAAANDGQDGNGAAARPTEPRAAG